MNNKNKPARGRKKPNKQHEKLAWYIMVGFNPDDIDQTGCLGIDEDPKAKSAYKIVDRLEARRFPSQNVNNIKGFGTPQQWLEFFNSDPELDGWKFHLVKVAE